MSNKTYYFLTIVIVAIVLFFGFFWGQNVESPASDETVITESLIQEALSSPTIVAGPLSNITKLAGKTVVGGENLRRDNSGAVLIFYTNKGFAPTNIEIRQGVTVRFVNLTDQGLRLASNFGEVYNPYPVIDQEKTMYKGESYFFLWNDVGTWDYYNLNKTADRGTVVVVPKK